MTAHEKQREELLREIESTGRDYQTKAFSPKRGEFSEYRQAVKEVEQAKDIIKMLDRAILAGDNTVIRAIGQVAYENKQYELFKKASEHDGDLARLAEHEELHGALRSNQEKLVFSMLVSAPQKVTKIGR